MKFFQRIASLVLGMCLMFTSPACVKNETQAKQLRVITTLFPLYDFTRNIVGDKADVGFLLPPGVEAHSFEPKPGDIVSINSAALFIYTGSLMEPWVEGVLKGMHNPKLLVIDASRGITLLRQGEANEQNDTKEGHEEKRHEHGKIDPHIWLDFTNAQKMIDNIMKGLVEKDPFNKGYYMKNAETYKARLEELDKQFKDALSSCKKDTFIHGGHFAFNYLARRFNLRYFSAYRGSPDSEPTPKRMIELKKKIKELGIKYIYYEELITPRVSDVIARETGATLLKLHGAHNISKEDVEKGATFIKLMEENLKNLKVGLECR